MNSPAGFDWSLLRSFLAVVDAGSLMGAARGLGLPQPTVSRHVAALESQLGAALFERTGRGTTPTAAGRAIIDGARAMQQGAERVSLSATGRIQADQGTVRISASQIVATCVLPPLIAALQQRAPGLEVALMSTNQVSNLLRREADVAVRMVRPQQASLIARKLADVPLGLYAHTDYLERWGRPRRLADLAQHRLVGPDGEGPLSAALTDAGVPPERQRYGLRTDDQVAGAQGVAQGLGIGVLPVYLAVRHPSLEPVLPTVAIEPMACWLAVHRELRSNTLIRQVFDHLAETLPVVLARPVSAR